MRRIFVACLIAPIGLGAVAAGAQSSSASLSVSASVVKNCTIATSPINFGNYDPVSANASSPLDGIGTVTITCTKGASAHIGLSNGSSNIGDTRRMRLSANSYLIYEIYKNPGRSDVWGDSFESNLDVGPAPSRQPRSFTAYGRVPAAQDATVGAYTDSVIATVNF